MNTKVPVTLQPVAGFCVKTSVLQSAVYSPANATYQGPQTLEPKDVLIPIPKGLKVFINIAWDANVPPPPEGSDDAIQQAMKGEDIDELNPEGWYVPVIVSEGRQDKDKSGNPSLVFDCIFNNTIKAKTLRDPEFKLFIVELALQRLEAQTSLLLSRQIGTPNIASKGKLGPRKAFIPSALIQSRNKPTSDLSASSLLLPGENAAPIASTGHPLVQELLPDATKVSSTTPTQPNSLPSLKGILKPSVNSPPSELTWTWAKEGNRIRINISVPGLDHSLVSNTTLDVEPRRLILAIPRHPVLDINLSLSDAELSARTTSAEHALTLKRQRDLDVDGATSDWLVSEKTLVVFV